MPTDSYFDTHAFSSASNFGATNFGSIFNKTVQRQLNILTELTIAISKVPAKLLEPYYERAKKHLSCPAFLRG